MPSVTTAFVHAMTQTAGLTLRPDGTVVFDGKSVFQLSRLPDGRIADKEFFDFINWIEARHCDRVALVANYAETIQIDDIGVLGLALKTAPNLRASLMRLERYFRLLTDTAAYRLDETDSNPCVVLDICTGEHPALSLRNECALAALTQNIRSFVEGELELHCVTFRHDCTSDPARYAKVFGCPVTFSASQDALILSDTMLDRTNRLGDEALSQFLTRQLDDAFQTIRDDTSLRDEISRRLPTALSSGVPQASELASDMGMSERTFFRRLSEEGTTFRDVVRDVQIRIARELLERGDCSIAEVAFLTGFSEQSSFGRAFKRCVGHAPAQYRSIAIRTSETLLADTVKTLAGPVDTTNSVPV